MPMKRPPETEDEKEGPTVSPGKSISAKDMEGPSTTITELGSPERIMPGARTPAQIPASNTWTEIGNEDKQEGSSPSEGMTLDHSTVAEGTVLVNYTGSLFPGKVVSVGVSGGVVRVWKSEGVELDNCV